jgi:ERCC4-type nuclease
MNVCIEVDYRECELFKCITALFPGQRPEQDQGEDPGPIHLESKPLDVGDVRICGENTTLLFERKTFADLAASIKDGRYKEQKARLMSVSPSHHHITYIFEEMPFPTQICPHRTMYGLSQSVFAGMVMNTLYRDGIHVLFMDTIEDTAKWVLLCAQKISQHPEKFRSPVEIRDSDYTQCIKLKSRRMDNITPDQCFIMQLSQIPTISNTLAKSIAHVFPTMSNLYQTLMPLDRETRLSKFRDIPKIGRKKAELVHAYLFPDNADT